MNSKVYELKDLEEVAEWLIEQASGEKIWIFQGQMGAGKTTLIKIIGKKLGLVDEVSSPTFSLVNHYETDQGETIYHFDFYRLEDPEEALDIGIEEYFYSGNYCWIEWPEKLGDYLPDHFLLVKIDYNSPTSRKITLEHFQDA
ncbi:tRNA (adenosine(37)-N6)-threonylcarbamoyltransferase complex ATPase subunit type 1 TsaE [Algoriphagus limi]|uniref:tRNA threonylcarbamoyladenosine biosynthesis protein TsaE n=1 Tax=Algoriphagus limi TaxID=2975273 RepID=A0ABT2G2T8_9BACT|nr:tRNA (adenosine(37)-N6)-threonylcarbamoyltransferase complex ATPase subunit type 1 TsaE [Algoriphagus limi]MCS5488811.1 tRNA (adenosine(37)-N6)-threonylcarbamoyltransferase complex ATPase subunit type 1 TsaE [Algoriphagus limi]